MYLDLPELLTREEEIKLCAIIKKGGTKKKVTEARNRFLESNIRLVIKIAKQITQGRSYGILSFDDLVSEGSIGLLRAVEKFDIDRGYKFSTYAHHWIKQAIYKAISNKSRTVRIPDHRVLLYLKIWEFMDDFKGRESRFPNSEEIGEKFGLNSTQVQVCLGHKNPSVSLDAPVSVDDQNGEKIGDLMEDEGAENSSTALDTSNLKEVIDEVLFCFKKREATIIKHRFGLCGLERLTLEEIGNQFKCTRERIRQIETTAIVKFRILFKEKNMVFLSDGTNHIN